MAFPNTLRHRARYLEVGGLTVDPAYAELVNQQGIGSAISKRAVTSDPACADWQISRAYVFRSKPRDGFSQHTLWHRARYLEVGGLTVDPAFAELRISKA